MFKNGRLVFSAVTILVALVTIFAYSAGGVEVKYYDAFKYVNDNEERKIIFINELKSTDTHNKWHIEVYFNRSGEWIRFKNISPNNMVYEIITNNLSIDSVTIKTTSLSK